MNIPNLNYGSIRKNNYLRIFTGEYDETCIVTDLNSEFISVASITENTESIAFPSGRFYKNHPQNNLELHPVFIDEEWLAALSFVPLNAGIFTHEDFVVLAEAENGWRISYQSGKQKWVKYVHELQNEYEMHTGKYLIK